MENIENLTQALLNQKFAGEPATKVKTERLSLAVQRKDSATTADNFTSTLAGGSFMMSSLGSLFEKDGNISIIDIKVGL